MKLLADFVEGWKLRRNINSIALLVFFFQIVLILPIFFPHLGDIGVWDEAVYINEGRDLLGGKLPAYAANPAVATLYALTYLPVHTSSHWLVHSCSIGRFILFALLWLASFLTACQLEELASPFIMIALVTISPALIQLLNNGSNALFAATSGFALWQFLSFQRTRNLKHLRLCSLFLGLATLSRNEGPVLFAVFLGLSLVLCLRDGVLRKGLTASLVPFTVLVGGYLLLYGLCTRDFNLGVAQRGYYTFEQGHGMAFKETYGTRQFYVEGEFDARRLFGTPEENHFSVLTAIRRNPLAYLKRILPLTRHVMKDVFADYSWYFGLLGFAFAARGIFDLIQRKSFMLLATLLLWPAYSILYVLLCYQPAHLLMPFLSVFTLASIGTCAFLRNLTNKQEHYFWSAGLFVLALIATRRGIISNGPLTATLVILLGFWLVWLTANRYLQVASIKAIASLLLLSIGLTVRFGLPEMKAFLPGSNIDEQAVTYLSTHFERGARIGAWAPGKIWDARLDPVTMTRDLRYWKSTQDASEWIARKKIRAIYVDKDLREFEPDVLSILQNQIGSSLSVALDVGHGAVQILVPTSSAK